jgi:hypothetical protein
LHNQVGAVSILYSPVDSSIFSFLVREGFRDKGGEKIEKGIELKQHSRKNDNLYIVLYVLWIIKNRNIRRSFQQQVNP